ncbi:hypothetical protein J3A83DRAFT_1606447 [Scleroderma citrinum]
MNIRELGSDVLSLSLGPQRKRFSFSRRGTDTITIDPTDVLTKSAENKYQKEHGRVLVVLGLPTQTTLDVTRNRSDPTPDNLRPTTEDLLSQCPRFRILVIGKSGVGKSSLINRAFGIETACVANDRPGQADINKELISPQNDRFILHDSRGFEPGEGDNYDVVKKFIQSRKCQPHISNQLHAVWLCFQVPLQSHGERLMERSAEQFLSEKRDILGDIVFTKYDRILTQEKIRNSVGYESEAEQYLKKHCIQPIQAFTGEEDISHVAVSSKQGQETGQGDLISLTFDKVSEHFKPQLNMPSPVPVVTLMAQRMLPKLKIDGSIDVGKQRYWRALATSPNFRGYRIEDCLGVIHTDIVSVWNFNDPSQHLRSKDFRELMVNMVGEIDAPILLPPSRIPTSSNMAESPLPLVILIPIILPFAAGLALVQWVHNTYQRLQIVQQRFMAYIVDLIHVLEILFALTANTSGKNLTRRAIKLAFKVYHDSQMKDNAHTRIRGFDFSNTQIPGRDIILEEIVSLARISYTDDSVLSQMLTGNSSANLEKDEDWHTVEDGTTAH